MQHAMLLILSTCHAFVSDSTLGVVGNDALTLALELVFEMAAKELKNMRD